MACATFSVGKSLGIREIRVSKVSVKYSLHASMNTLVSFVGCQKWSPLSPFHIRRSLMSSCWSLSAKAPKASNDYFEPSGAPSSGNGDSTEEKVNVLVIGGGGREHALCYALKRSPSCDAVFCAPGNAGIASSGSATCISDLNISDSSAVVSFCQEWGIGLVVVGPEASLVAGLANDLVKAGIPTFGPSAEAAALEGSKDFMKSIRHLQAHPRQSSTLRSKEHQLLSRQMV